MHLNVSDTNVVDHRYTKELKGRLDKLMDGKGKRINVSSRINKSVDPSTQTGLRQASSLLICIFVCLCVILGLTLLALKSGTECKG